MALQSDATVIGCQFRCGGDLVQKMPAMKDQRSKLYTADNASDWLR